MPSKFNKCTICQQFSAVFDPGNRVVGTATPRGFPVPTVPADNEPTPNRLALNNWDIASNKNRRS